MRLRDLRPDPTPAGVAAVAAVTWAPMVVLRSAAAAFPTSYYLSSPDGRAVAGLGLARRHVASGRDRFDRLRVELEAAEAFIGWSFSADGPDPGDWEGFAAAEAVVPEVTVRGSADGSTLRIVAASAQRLEEIVALLESLEIATPPAPPDPGDHAVEAQPPAAAWRSAVAEAVEVIGAGSLRKVVLARSALVTTEVPPRPLDLVHHLDAAYTRSHVFAWSTGRATFLGASPELLVEVTGDEVRSNPLAGSAPRGEGELEDRLLGDALLTSVKDRHEHRLVVEEVAQRLRPFTTRLDVPEVPSLRRMATVQHLSTALRGRLSRPTHLLEVVSALHPTPAVGGTPAAEALAFIDKAEPVDRGWYTGGIGWVDAGGRGLAVLALRCGLLRGRTARLYAGAGIVAASDPDAELAETRLKFRPLLDLLAVT